MRSTQQDLDRSTLVWIFLAQGFVIFPLFFKVPLWLPVVWLGAIAWRVQIFRGAWPYPHFILKSMLGLGCVAGLLLSYAGQLGVEPLVAFLVVSFVLKLVELRKRGDALLVIYIGFVAVAAQFLFYQSFLIAVYGMCSAVLLIAAWTGIYRQREVTIGQQMLGSAWLLLQAIPLMLILFLVMPRLGQLWSVPLPSSSGTTGFSDSLSPGDFSQLIRSQETAFRVTFDEGESAIPAPEQRYWRGLVLEEFNGRAWRRNPALVGNQAIIQPATRPPIRWGLVEKEEPDLLRYSVLLEPHQQRWLFTLVAPRYISSTKMRIGFARSFLALNWIPVNARVQYDVVSTTDFLASPGGLSRRERQTNLKLPDDASPKARELAQSWVEQGLTPQQIIDAALQQYRDSFSYTLRPPPLGTHTVDEFLFITRKGFCEHFASSFTFLMRAAGIPARVVVGYQGGEANPVEKYLVVKQSDAHAWAEVWLQDEGWVRVDPTAAVSPARIERGLTQSLLPEESALVSSGLLNASDLPWLQQLTAYMDAWSYTWHRWVLAYDTNTQKRALDRLIGGVEPWRIAAFLVGGGLLCALLYFLPGLIVRTKGEQYVQERIYRRFLKKMAKRGYAKELAETPLAFAERVAESEPQWRASLLRIALLFNKISYQGDGALSAQLNAEVRRFPKS